MVWIAFLVALALGAGLAVWLLGITAAQQRDAVVAEAAAKVELDMQRQRLEIVALASAQVAEAQAEALQRRTQSMEEISAAHERMSVLAGQAEGARTDVAAMLAEAERRAEIVAAHTREVTSLDDSARGINQDAEAKLAQALAVLEARGNVQRDAIVKTLQRGWVTDAAAQAQAAMRKLEANMADPEYDRHATRLLEIASSRYQNHFLTERNVSNLRVGGDIVALALANDGAIHQALEQVCGITLILNDDHTAFRMEGLDGVGREVARRGFARLAKPELVEAIVKNPTEWATKLRANLEQEINTLGRKAFHLLGIERAHPEIVGLVGALNYRTSYTQNQWLHAVESSFLAGMMAAELGLDEKLARRATLMHDIGKALTHKIEGSHAVIGADIARRLGETELVANAIGSHHADEPANSSYAYLVAAADAMSGARPGARREQQEGFSGRVEDLERIAASYRGVEYAHAVHGGRELRVYVDNRDIGDADVMQLSTDIAAQVSDELTFPGQIKVTVIRAYEAVAVAS
ncbi:MAG: HDIG domain-containing protein [Myxococcales bacterium]|nr:HDIG domain-containing protein [Myxococcales bacterium]